MKLLQMYLSPLIAVMMLVLPTGLDTSGFAQVNSAQRARNIVLVHGA